MARVISPCNGLAVCWRHRNPVGCSKIVLTPPEEYELRNKRKARRRRLWRMVLEQYRGQAKWGLGPTPRAYHLNVVLLLEQLLSEEEVFANLKAMGRMD